MLNLELPESVLDEHILILRWSNNNHAWNHVWLATSLNTHTSEVGMIVEVCRQERLTI